MTTSQINSSYNSFQINLKANYVQSLTTAIHQKNIQQIKSLLEICLSFIHWNDLDFLIKPIAQHSDRQLLEYFINYPFLFQKNNGRIIFEFIQYGNLPAIQYLETCPHLLIHNKKNMSDLFQEDKKNSLFLFHSIMYQQFHISDYFIEQGWNINDINLKLLFHYREFILNNIDKTIESIYYLYHHFDNKSLLINKLYELNISSINLLLKQYKFKDQLELELAQHGNNIQIKL